MKLIQKLSQQRRDFMGEYECENCHTKDTIRGYDDTNFHVNVMPYVKCMDCGKSTIDIGAPVVNVETKYPDYLQV